MTAYRIGQLAKQVGVPVSTVRYYERRGLLKADGRTEGNYRQYGEPALERLRFIRSAQAIGFTLDDVAVLLGLRDGSADACAEVQRLVEARITDVEQRLKEIRHVRRFLRAALKACQTSASPEECAILMKLSSDRPRKKRKVTT